MNLSWPVDRRMMPAQSHIKLSKQRRNPKDMDFPKVQARQLLSCTKCRERKVKCDRTKPCSACCARGRPKECQFVVGEGSEYGPIQQSYEIRKLRAENQRLREQLQSPRMLSPDSEGHHSADSRDRSKTAARAATYRQRRFAIADRTDNLYFGTPCLANIVTDFASLSADTRSLVHAVPTRNLAHEVYTSEGSMYPFPILWADNKGSSSPCSALVDMLPPHHELWPILERFQSRAQSGEYGYLLDQTTRKEIEHFLHDVIANAEGFPDMLALIFAILAGGLQMGQSELIDEPCDVAEVEVYRRKCDVLVAASMQGLRQASFLNQPTMLAIQTLVILGSYLTNSGRFLDAWTLFGTTIRLAHSLGLHRNPKYLDPQPPLRECTNRQSLWWWLLHTDQQYSVILGRPLGISGIGDCPSPDHVTTNPTRRRLDDCFHHFTLIARQVLSSEGLNSVARIDDLTEKLLGFWDTIPELLQLKRSWLQKDTDLPEWPLDVKSASLFAEVQSLLMRLGRQRAQCTQSASREDSPNSTPDSCSQAAFLHLTNTEHFLPTAESHNRSLVVDAAVNILFTLLFFHHRYRSTLIPYTILQDGFSACMILIVDETDTEAEDHEQLITEALAVFLKLRSQGPHTLAHLAVQRISDGLAQLKARKAELPVHLNEQDSSSRSIISLDKFSTNESSSDGFFGSPSNSLGAISYMSDSLSSQASPWNSAGMAVPQVVPHYSTFMEHDTFSAGARAFTS